jgi:hypothetical protein
VFPTISATTSGFSTSGSTSHPITLPPGATGDLMLAELTVMAGTDINWTGTGFTELTGWDLGGGNKVELAYRFRTGSEGPTITPTSSGSGVNAWLCTNIKNMHPSQAPESSIAAAATSSINPNPVSPSWGATQNLIMHFVGHNNGATAPSFPDTRDQVVARWNNSAGAGVAMCTSDASPIATSLDSPNNWNFSPSAAAILATEVAIRPAIFSMGMPKASAPFAPDPSIEVLLKVAAASEEVVPGDPGGGGGARPTVGQIWPRET